jgi:hypothetical protein
MIKKQSEERMCSRHCTSCGKKLNSKEYKIGSEASTISFTLCLKCRCEFLKILSEDLNSKDEKQDDLPICFGTYNCQPEGCSVIMDCKINRQKEPDA